MSMLVTVLMSVVIYFFNFVTMVIYGVYIYLLTKVIRLVILGEFE